MAQITKQYRRVPLVIDHQDRTTGEISQREAGWGLASVVDGQPTDLFPVGCLTRAISRSHYTVTDWERVVTRTFWRGGEKMEAEFAVLPQPLYSVPGSHVKRWYTRGQIDLVRKILLSEDVVPGKNKVDWHGIAGAILKDWRTA